MTIVTTHRVRVDKKFLMLVNASRLGYLLVTFSSYLPSDWTLDVSNRWAIFDNGRNFLVVVGFA